MKRLAQSLLVVLLCVFSTQAAVRLPYFISDNMVLQQKSNVNIWGWTTANNKVNITTGWDHKKYTTQSDDKGNWKLKLATPAAGGPFEITISDGTPVTLKNILIGEVWLCSGQSNMEMPLKGFKDQYVMGSNEAILNSTNDQIRLYTVPRSVQRNALDTSKRSDWKSSNPENVAGFSATAYFFGKKMYEILKVPIGLVNISYGGTPVEAFMDVASLKSFPEIKIPSATDTTVKLGNRTPTVLYNGMLNPFLGYTIKGCIWYQGESNNDHAKQYETLFPAFVKMVQQKSENENLPFYYAQIAPYTYTNGAIETAPVYNSAYLRDAQRKALKLINNGGMVSLMDIGEEFSIHPAQKEVGGNRFAYMALAKTYGLKGFGYDAPLYDSMSIAGNVITIKFTNASNGLMATNRTLLHFEIAATDKIFRPAKAVISQGKVLVSSPEVTSPVAVRYAFKDFVVGDLFNTEGFPASSFRTDNW